MAQRSNKNSGLEVRVPNLCRNCGKLESEAESGKLTRCAKCQVVSYCSRLCQKEHWKHGGHKNACAPLKPPLDERRLPNTKAARKGDSAFKRLKQTLEKEDAPDEGGVGRPKERTQRKKEREAALGLLTDVAETGEPYAQKFLGLYLCAQGTAHDPSEALQWFEKAAAQGMYSLYDNCAGIYQSQGNLAEVERCFQRGFDGGEKALVTNLAIAQCNLAMKHLLKGGQKDSMNSLPPEELKKGEGWARKAAHYGNQKACRLLYTLLMSTGRQKEASYWLERSQHADDPNYQPRTSTASNASSATAAGGATSRSPFHGSSLEQRKESPTHRLEALLQRAKAESSPEALHVTREEIEKLLPDIIEHAGKDDEDASRALKSTLFDVHRFYCEGAAKDLVAAERHLQTAVNRMDHTDPDYMEYRACLSSIGHDIALAYYHGKDGMERDVEAAINWARRAAARRRHRGLLYNMAKEILTGDTGTEGERDSALKVLRLEGEAGDLESCLLLAEYYASEDGRCPESKESCTIWSDKAQEATKRALTLVNSKNKQNIDERRREALLFYLSGGDYLAVPGGLVSLEKQFTKVVTRYSKIIDELKDGMIDSQQLLEECPAFASAMEDIASQSNGDGIVSIKQKACHHLYQLYAQEQASFADSGKAQKYLEMGAEAGEASLQMKLADSFLKGHGGVRKTVHGAIKWYQAASKNNRPDASQKLGVIYSGDSDSVQRDFDKAAQFFEDALANSQAQDVLKQEVEGQLRKLCVEAGKAYFLGSEDIDRNFKKAKVWLQKAADKGAPSTAEMLDIAAKHLLVGSKVKLRGLSKKPEFNDTFGVVVGKMRTSDDRYPVKLEIDGVERALRIENLEQAPSSMGHTEGAKDDDDSSLSSKRMNDAELANAHLRSRIASKEGPSISLSQEEEETRDAYVNLLRDAAQAGSIEATLRLAEHFMDSVWEGHFTDEAASLLEGVQDSDLGYENNSARLEKYLQLCIDIGQHYLRFEDLEDRLQSVRWLEKADERCRRDDYRPAHALCRAHHELGVTYYNLTSDLDGLYKAYDHLIVALEYDVSHRALQDNFPFLCEKIKEKVIDVGTEDTLLDAVRIFEPAAMVLKGAAHETLMEFKHTLFNFRDTAGDASKALEYLEEAAEGGLPNAQYELAQYLENEGQLSTAVHWYTKLAERGVGVAMVQHHLGMIHAQGGDGVPVDLHKAEKFLRLAAKQGFPAALVDLVTAHRLLGMKYSNGDEETPKDQRMGEFWLKRAALEGDDEARQILASMKQQAVPATDAAVRLKSVPDHAIRKLENARQRLETITSLPRIKNRQGKKFDSLIGKDKKELLAVQRLLKDAAKDDHPKAQYILADMLYEGEFAQKDIHEGWKMLQKSSSAGVPEAQVRLAEMYLKGQNAKKDLRAASELFDKAASQGSWQAMRHLGKLYSSGEEGAPRKDLLAAESWLWKALDSGGDEATKKDLANLQDEIGHSYEEGKNGFTKNLLKALSWFEKSEANGCKSTIEFGNVAFVQNSIGTAYADGSDGYTIDIFEAEAFLEKAKARNESYPNKYFDASSNIKYLVDMQLELALHYEIDDFQHALHYYRKAAAEGNKKAKRHLCSFLMKRVQECMNDETYADVEGKQEVYEYVSEASQNGDQDEILALGYECALALELDIGKYYMDSTEDPQPRLALLWLERALDSMKALDSWELESTARSQIATCSSNLLYGEVCRLTDLVDRTELNGSLALVSGLKDDDDRYLVNIDPSGEQIRVDETNLCVIEQEEIAGTDDEADEDDNEEGAKVEEQEEEDDVIFCDEETSGDFTADAEIKDAPATPVHPEQENKNAGKSSSKNKKNKKNKKKGRPDDLADQHENELNASTDAWLLEHEEEEKKAKDERERKLMKEKEKKKLKKASKSGKDARDRNSPEPAPTNDDDGTNDEADEEGDDEDDDGEEVKERKQKESAPVPSKEESSATGAEAQFIKKDSKKRNKKGNRKQNSSLDERRNDNDLKVLDEVPAVVAAGQSHISILMEFCGEQQPRHVLETVLKNCNGDLEAAMEAVMELPPYVFQESNGALAATAPLPLLSPSASEIGPASTGVSPQHVNADLPTTAQSESFGDSPSSILPRSLKDLLALLGIADVEDKLREAKICTIQDLNVEDAGDLLASVELNSKLRRKLVRWMAAHGSEYSKAAQSKAALPRKDKVQAKRAALAQQKPEAKPNTAASSFVLQQRLRGEKEEAAKVRRQERAKEEEKIRRLKAEREAAAKLKQQDSEKKKEENRRLRAAKEEAAKLRREQQSKKREENRKREEENRQKREADAQQKRMQEALLEKQRQEERDAKECHAEEALETERLLRSAMQTQAVDDVDGPPPLADVELRRASDEPFADAVKSSAVATHQQQTAGRPAVPFAQNAWTTTATRKSPWTTSISKPKGADVSGKEGGRGQKQKLSLCKVKGTAALSLDWQLPSGYDEAQAMSEATKLSEADEAAALVEDKTARELVAKYVAETEDVERLDDPARNGDCLIGCALHHEEQIAQLSAVRAGPAGARSRGSIGATSSAPSIGIVSTRNIPPALSLRRRVVGQFEKTAVEGIAAKVKALEGRCAQLEGVTAIAERLPSRPIRSVDNRDDDGEAVAARVEWVQAAARVAEAAYPDETSEENKFWTKVRIEGEELAMEQMMIDERVDEMKIGGVVMEEQELQGLADLKSWDVQVRSLICIKASSDFGSVLKRTYRSSKLPDPSLDPTAPRETMVLLQEMRALRTSHFQHVVLKGPTGGN